MPLPLYHFCALPPRRISVDIVGTSIEGGRSISGASQSIDFSGGGYWRVDYGELVIRRKWQHRYLNYLRNYLTGSINAMVVPIYTDFIAPYPLDANGQSIGSIHDIPHSDQTLFSDGVGYMQSNISAWVVGAFGQNVSTIALRVNTGRRLEPGDSFSIEHPTKGWRYYGIVTIDSINPEDDPGNDTLYTVGIRPPLREAITDLADVEFFRPRCTMKLAPGSSLPWDTPTTGWFTTADISFVESFADV